MQKAYEEAKFTADQFPIATLIAETCLSLPIYPGMDKEQINYICATVKSFYA